MKRPDIVKQITETMHRIEPTAHIILYGSEARGDAKADSDIDLLVLLEEDNKADSDIDLLVLLEEDNEHTLVERELNIVRQLYEIELETGVIISPHIVLRRLWEQQTTPFSMNVIKEGITL